MAFDLARASADDLPFVMATERLPGYDQLVGRWDEARHRAALAKPAYAYFLGRENGKPVGFAIVRDWDSPERVTLVKRIAVTTPGNGHGRKLLVAAVDRIFEDTECHRLWIGVFPENVRARRAYEAIGFVAEGVARGSAWFGGAYRDELVLSLLRPEWLARRGGDVVGDSMP
jgi:RimJ/RimL family protein N-acetyltransferase